MATSVVAFTCDVPAGSNPAFVNMYVGTDPVVAIRWRVPAGPRGHLSFALAQSNTQILPSQLGDYIVAENEWDTWTLDNLPANPTWQLIGFNTGADDHKVYLQFYVDAAQNPVVTTGGGGDILTGFPTGEGDVPTSFLV